MNAIIAKTTSCLLAACALVACSGGGGDTPPPQQDDQPTLTINALQVSRPGYARTTYVPTISEVLVTADNEIWVCTGLNDEGHKSSSVFKMDSATSGRLIDGELGLSNGVTLEYTPAHVDVVWAEYSETMTIFSTNPDSNFIMLLHNISFDTEIGQYLTNGTALYLIEGFDSVSGHNTLCGKSRA